MTKRLHEKVCLITGTGGSIGRAAALRFAEEGALVVGCDTNVAAGQETVELVKASGGRMVSLHPVDLGVMAQCQRLVDFTIAEHVRIDVLFNNAPWRSSTGSKTSAKKSGISIPVTKSTRSSS
ncbi:SDR family NAD(P)-dependent oxidoreductase [Xanthomonas hortorum NBC5720]|nr:SDR family NAD(P)-dependent oxidoreductase [Xanthomonas hortorum]MDV2453608.1 SDR family NAD(P)-dependent oxidoreductase [Xanthomonas hortorum NBC5720]